jgi:hypothetical protein
LPGVAGRRVLVRERSFRNPLPGCFPG